DVDEGDDPEETGTPHPAVATQPKDDRTLPLPRHTRRLHCDEAKRDADDERNRIAGGKRNQATDDNPTDQHENRTDVGIGHNSLPSTGPCGRRYFVDRCARSAPITSSALNPWTSPSESTRVANARNRRACSDAGLASARSASTNVPTPRLVSKTP